MIKVYRGTDGDTSPVERECEVFGYPHRTTDGEQMSENTHFRTEAEAWDSILVSVDAGVCLSGRRVSEAVEELVRREKAAAKMAQEYAEARDLYTIWQAEQREKEGTR